MNRFVGRSETTALEWFARLVSFPAILAAVAVPINQLTQPGGAVDATIPIEPARVDPGVHYANTKATVQLEFELTPFLIAGLVFVVAGVFERGRQLAQETEGLI